MRRSVAAALFPLAACGVRSMAVETAAVHEVFASPIAWDVAAETPQTLSLRLAVENKGRHAARGVVLAVEVTQVDATVQAYVDAGGRIAPGARDERTVTVPIADAEVVSVDVSVFKARRGR